MDRGDVRFREVLDWDPWPRRLLMGAGILTVTLVAVPFCVLAYRQLVRGVPLGRPPLPDAALVALTLGVILLSLLPFVFLRARLVVEVDGEGLSIGFLGRRRVSWMDIAGARAVDVPWWIGWGVRWNGRSWYYRIRGRRAVEVELRSGKRITVSSERPDELIAALATR
jgi:hypothetical protein